MKKLWNTDMKQFYLKLFIFNSFFYGVFFLMVNSNKHYSFNILTGVLYTITTTYLFVNYIKEFKK